MGGLSTFRKGQSKLGNKFMQARVVVQASTVLAMSSGAYFASHKTQEEKRKSYEERVQLELRK
jgi:hypothetical protein